MRMLILILIIFVHQNSLMAKDLYLQGIKGILQKYKYLNISQECNLYAQACLDSETDYAKINKELTQIYLDNVLEAYQKLAKSLKFDSIDEYFKAEMSQYNLNIRKYKDSFYEEEDRKNPYTDHSFTEVFKREKGFFDSDYVTRDFNIELEAAKIKVKIEKIIDEKDEVKSEDLEKSLRFYHEFKQRVEKEILQVSLSFPLSLMDFLQSTCYAISDQKVDGDEEKSDDSSMTSYDRIEKLRKIIKSNLCQRKKLIQLKQQVLLFQSGKIKKNILDQTIKKFIQENKVTEFFVPSAQVLEHDESIRDKVSTIAYSLFGYVNSYKFQHFIQAHIGKIVDKTLVRMNSSQVVVDHLIEVYYGESRNDYFKLLSHIKSEFISFLKTKFVDSKILTEEKMIDHIFSTYQSLPVKRMNRPDDSFYIEKNGLKVLNPEITESVKDTSPYTTFVDSDLSYFSVLNASYMPHVHSVLMKEQINIYPGMSLLFNYNKMALIEVFAHELSHKIGPDVSWTNGHDMTGYLEPLISCFESNHSFKMIYHQKDEAFADWLAAEFVAYYLAKNNFKQEELKDQIRQTVGLYCLFDSRPSSSYIEVDNDDPHPDSFFRVNAIFATQPFIQKSLSCENNLFNYCPLK